MTLNFVTFRTAKDQGGIQNTGYILSEFFAHQMDLDFLLFADDKSDVPTGCACSLIPCGEVWNFGFFLRIVRYIQKARRADINLCAHWQCALGAYFQKKRENVPYAVMVYGNEIIQNVQCGVKGWIKEATRAKILNYADVIFACSEYTLKLCKRVSKNDNIQVIHPPICYRESSLMDNKKNYIMLSVGRNVERKGFQYVIEAMPALLKKYPTLQYRIVGDGPFHAVLADRAEKLRVSEHVRFLGRISEEEKNFQLAMCDVFVMTSLEDLAGGQVEGFGVCYIEANMHGKWVIASRCGGVTDAVVDGITGELISTVNAESICAAVDHYYTDVAVDRDSVLKWAQKHDAAVIGNEYLNVLRKIVIRAEQN